MFIRSLCNWYYILLVASSYLVVGLYYTCYFQMSALDFLLASSYPNHVQQNLRVDSFFILLVVIIFSHDHHSSFGLFQHVFLIRILIESYKACRIHTFQISKHIQVLNQVLNIHNMCKVWQQRIIFISFQQRILIILRQFYGYQLLVQFQ